MNENKIPATIKKKKETTNIKFGSNISSNLGDAKHDTTYDNLQINTITINNLLLMQYWSQQGNN